MTSESVEDYMEAIYNLIERDGEARTQKLAEELDIQPPSVSEMMQKLDQRGFVDYKKYGRIKLTDEGERLARDVKETHNAIKCFLTAIGVPEEIAEKDACKAEHGLDRKTVEQLKKFSRFIRECPKDGPTWVKHFEFYSENGFHPEECC
ncbi:MAG: Mn-dependent transcriptional regulator DtxR family [Candidatus Methanohalarchaeum thermophilum]|uniref:Mn-dependent transcriptional regulator DtxR family n=1 Tax=Methanohalarchaeum thermophilum TaxID=1903181 RepID=A0A1Q6DTP8_METT1|nr:MAG: Mn-dependent transcriptional regulator DtxR family [Candidatus Methanohalarchaeum thermophilum]